MEGIATVAVGVILPFILPDSPARAKFMSETEKALYVKRLQLDNNTGGGADSEQYKNKYLLQALTDWKIYLCTAVFFGNSIPVYGSVVTGVCLTSLLTYSSGLYTPYQPLYEILAILPRKP